MFRDYYNDESYKILNKNFPCIEGHLFQPLTHVLVAHGLCYGTILHKHRTNWEEKNNSLIFIRILNINGFKFSLYLDSSTKRLNFHVEHSSVGIGRQINERMIQESIYKKFNIMRATYPNQHTHYYQYSFKYNFKNCKRIVEIVRELPHLFEEEN